MNTEIPQSLLEALPPGRPEPELRLVERAYQVAAYWHRGQRRKSGDPYITHPVAVATIVAELDMDHHLVCAALLHDVVEDTRCTSEELRAEFGDRVGDLVDGAMTFGWAEFRAWQDDPDAVDEQVLMLRLADRLHNMRTVRFITPDKQRLRSAETLQVFAPLARRLGLRKIGGELQYLARTTLLEQSDVRAELPVSGRALSAAALLLPAAARARWLEEWLGELHTLSPRGRARFIGQLLYGMPRLAITLRRPGTSRAIRVVLRLLRWILASNTRTWSLLLPFVAWMVIETGRDNAGDAVVCLITVPPVLVGGIEWLRGKLDER